MLDIKADGTDERFTVIGQGILFDTADSLDPFAC